MCGVPIPVGNGVLCEFYINTMSADALAPCVARSSTATILTTYSRHVLVFVTCGKNDKTAPFQYFCTISSQNILCYIFLHNQQIECWNQYLDYMIWNLIRTCRLKEHTMLENSRSCPNRIISMCAGRLLRTICLADHQDGTARWHMETGKPARWRDDIRHAGYDAANPMLSTMLWVPDS